jgi:hypothetical protein
MLFVVNDEDGGLHGGADVAGEASSRKAGLQGNQGRRIKLERANSVYFANAGRNWSVENQLHRSLRVSFEEDRSRARTRHAATLRRIALNLLRADKSSSKSLRCAPVPEHLISLLKF